MTGSGIEAHASGDIQKVCSCCFNQSGCLYSIFLSSSAGQIIRTAKTDRNRIIGAYCFANLLYRFREEPCPVLHILGTVFILAFVGQRRIKLVQKISMGTVDLNTVIASCKSTKCCTDKQTFYLMDFFNA